MPNRASKAAAIIWWIVGMGVLVVLGVGVLLPSTKRARFDPDELRRMTTGDDMPATPASTSRPTSIPTQTSVPTSLPIAQPALGEGRR